jgi:hypothetical protein
MVRYEKYKLGSIDEKIVKIGSFMHDFGEDTVGHVDGLTVHPGTGWIVSSCPEGLCIIDFKDEGKLLAHAKIDHEASYPPIKFSNVTFGKDKTGKS